MTPAERAILDRDPVFQAWLDDRQAEFIDDEPWSPDSYWRLTAKGEEVVVRFRAWLESTKDETA